MSGNCASEGESFATKFVSEPEQGETMAKGRGWNMVAYLLNLARARISLPFSATFSIFMFNSQEAHLATQGEHAISLVQWFRLPEDVWLSVRHF